MLKKTALFLIPLALAACSKNPGEARISAAAVSVRVAPAAREDAGRSVTVPGTVRARREAMLASRIMGQIVRKRVQPGDDVAVGRILVELDDRTVQGQIAQARGALAQAQAALSLAGANHQRFQELAERKAASALELDMARMQFEQATGAVEQAKGALEAASSMQDDSTVKAPFSGKVLEVMAKEGDMAVPGYPLVRLADPTSMELWVEVGESDIPSVREASSIRCTIPAAGPEARTCAIAEIVPASDPMTHTFTVKLKPAELGGLRPGLYGKAEFTFPGTGSGRVVVPSQALIQRGQLAMVFTVEGGKAAMKAVRAGETGSGRVEILSGLSGGEQVVVEGADRLEQGSPVEVRP
jgi:membrane fusion protein, multidrug efflux system